jgi:hypothetical protein
MMYEQSLDAVKGWFHLAALDKSAKLNATLLATATDIPAGRVAILNDAGEFTTDRTGAGGGTCTNSATAMPIFLLNSKFDPDVSNVGLNPASTVTNWYAISPTGVMTGLVATGGYELQSTEFYADGTYLPNQPLTAVTTTGVLTDASATVGNAWICGICSTHVNGDNQTTQATPGSAVGVNAHGVSVITFWPVFLPKTRA